MSKYILKCSTLYRLSQVCKFFSSDANEEAIKQLNLIRLEISNGKMFAISTNKKIASIEYIGTTAEPDSFNHLKITDEFVKEMQTGVKNDYSATITTMPEIAFSSIKSDSGVEIMDCCDWSDNAYLGNWRKWASPEITKNVGFMSWELYHVELLMSASPSGEIIFPKFIDFKKAIVLRDRFSENWVGLFVPSIKDEENKHKPAVLPDWWK